MQLHLPTQFSIQSAGTRVFNGTTLNMSRSGVLIECLQDDYPVQSGDLAYLQIELPVLQNLQQRCMACSGTVVRVEADQERRRLAITLETMQFQDADFKAVVGRIAAPFVM